jgi:hypothetical protein
MFVKYIGSWVPGSTSFHTDTGITLEDSTAFNHHESLKYYLYIICMAILVWIIKGTDITKELNT